MTPPAAASATLAHKLAGALALVLSVGVVAELLPPAMRVPAWAAAIGLAGWCFWRGEPLSANFIRSRGISVAALGLLTAVAALTRILWINRIPQGAYVDEVLALKNTLRVLEGPFDPFGQTNLLTAGWVETSNLYLGFNAAIIRLFGVSYVSLKLFSVIPGVVACVFFYGACIQLFRPRLALLVALLFTVAQWHIRLSRYGWDASFVVMAFAGAVWLFLAARDGRLFPMFLSGVLAGIGLYGYITGRLCVATLTLFLATVAAWTRKKADVGRFVAFVAGTAIAAAPLLSHHLHSAGSAWVRVGELSVFNKPDSIAVLLNNLWRHALMFNFRGGLYARDNYPGLPMLDVVSGILFVIGIVVIALRRRDHGALLLPVLLVGTLLGGVFSVSPEGAPYVLRASAAVVPCLLIVGIGVEAVDGWAVRSRKSAAATNWVWAAEVGMVCVAIALNLHGYFGLEPQNISATRVMGAEYRLLGDAIRQTDTPVFFLVPGVFKKLPNRAEPGERYFEANRNFSYGRFGKGVSYFAVLAFSGRYDVRHTIEENWQRCQIHALQAQDLTAPIPLPFTIILHPDEAPLMSWQLGHYQNSEIQNKTIDDAFGKKAFLVITIRAREALSQGLPVGR